MRNYRSARSEMFVDAESRVAPTPVERYREFRSAGAKYFFDPVCITNRDNAKRNGKVREKSDRSTRPITFNRLLISKRLLRIDKFRSLETGLVDSVGCDGDVGVTR